ncbi:uncharacterized protein LOC133832951 [Humulus lupulus]|uniref:uncharacterized protein LOC133832951 n=1 Tax=Humulus lupulus TaxID=3486 RepID=UPI002B40DA78|nr:uncharacterized protein LOC133832951 [Humulus lupulus]
MDDISKDGGDITLLVMVSEVNLVNSNPREWLIDTGSTWHICSDKILFKSFEQLTNGEKLFMGNSATSKIEGQGKVILKMTFGKELTLNNVLYISDIRKNLVSCSLLNKHGFHMVLESDKDQGLESEDKLRRRNRINTEKSFGLDFLIYLLKGEPQSFNEVVSSTKGSSWKESINNEI